MQVKRQQLDRMLEQEWFQIRKGVQQGLGFSPCYLTYMLSTSGTYPWSTCWDHICHEKYQQPYYDSHTYLYGKSEEKMGVSMKVAGESEKSWYSKTNIPKTKIIA